MNSDVIIRLEEEKDYSFIEKLVRDSFWNVYRPGCLEHFVLKEMRSDPDFVKELDYVMEKDGSIIGQNVFVKARINCDNGSIIPVLTMGPICIRKDLRHMGYGKMLLDYTLEEARKLGYGAILIEGNIEFYKNSNFTYAKNYNIRYHGLDSNDDSSFFLAIELIDGYLSNISGEYSTPDIYFVCEKKEKEFLEYESKYVSIEK